MHFYQTRIVKSTKKFIQKKVYKIKKKRKIFSKIYFREKNKTKQKSNKKQTRMSKKKSSTKSAQHCNDMDYYRQLIDQTLLDVTPDREDPSPNTDSNKKTKSKKVPRFNSKN